MAANGMPQGGAPASKDPMPECTREYWPAQGGYMGDTIESDGAPGDKDGTGISAVTGNTEEGEYDTAVNTFGNFPHGAADPSLEGPPLASNPGPNGLVDSSPAPATLPNDRVKAGY